MAPTREIEKLQRRWQENPLGLTFAPLAEAYRKEGMHADALELLDIGLSQHPNYVPAHIVRGRCYLDLNQLTDAEAAFHRVTELDPDNVIALQELADIAERGGRFEEAEARLERLLDFDRSNEDARAQLDRIKAELASRASTPEATPVPVPTPGPATPPPAASEAAFAQTLVPEPAPAPEPVAEPAPQKAEILTADVTVSTYQPLDLGTVAAAPPHPPNDEAPAASAAPPEASIAPEFPEPPSDAWPPTGGASFELESPAAEPATPYVTHESEPVFEPDLELAPPGPSTPWPDEPAAPPVEAAAPAEPAPRSEAATGAVDEWIAGLSPADSEPPAPPPPPALEPAPPVEAVHEPDAADASADLEQGDPDLVVTETMAEIFLRQGHRELALAVYSQLLTRDPSNGRIRAAAERLEIELRPAGGAPGLPAYAAVLTGGQSVRSFFESLLGSSRPGGAPSSGPLSLGAVFGDDRTPAGVEAAAPAGGESFDEFFGAESAPMVEPLSTGPAQPTPDPVEDIEEFNSWLKGLKR